ncbi:protein of unknown function [Gordonia malaquae]|uniref:DUF4178 domain-containing protein n=1 Tax=Gordonia malaquae NBRC 108250 TaxID=1223542 RepID=M3TGB6_GORML|nr:DUF4178 domain-containing protein [Gordonia malaquae]GAC80511.1 hypothetical protein GM1_018_00740 [Gordonia malaquae NBRC 108250]SEE17180.1 protein of unknown function [Gordonia malaquae]
MDIALILIIALLAIIAVFVVFHILGQRKLREAEADGIRQRAYAPADPFSSADDDAVHGNPRELEPGDMVEIRGTTYAVRGTMTLTQDGFSWVEHFIDTGTGSKAWISVEDDPDLEVVLWQEQKGVTVVPGEITVDLDGRRYRFDEAGSARFSSLGTTGVAGTGRMAYQDYEAGDERLTFEDYGFGWECGKGQVLHHSEYRVYPADSGPTT